MWFVYKKILEKICYYDIKVIRMFDKIFPKNNNIFILGTFHGKYLKDNVYYFYDYLRINEKKIQFIMFIENEIHRKELQNNYPLVTVLNPFSVKGLYYALCARVVIIIANLVTEVPNSYLFSNKKIIVNLWHGVPMKGVCLTDAEWDERQRKYFLSRESNRYDLMTASSKMERMINSATFGVPYSNITISGSPRNDYMFHYLHGSKKIKSIMEYFPHKKNNPSKIILYAPTKRENGAPVMFPFHDRDLELIDKYCSSNNLLLVIRGHFSNVTNIEYGIIDFSTFDKFQSIVTLNIDVVDNVNDILHEIDILITDYSGIYWDFLLLERPVIFFPYDIEEYERIPGLQFDYELITAGPKVFSQKEFLRHLDMYVKNPSIDSEKRIFIRDLIHKYFDGKACDRIYEEILSLIEQKS